jgi:hypothetical protein
VLRASSVKGGATGSVQPTRVRTTVSCSGGTALGEGPVGGP